MMKLTEKQKEHLKVLCDGSGPRSAYRNSLHMGILKSLEDKGLVRAWRGLGSIAMPHTAIKWSITDAGRAILGK
jgi:hypothetical protein